MQENRDSKKINMKHEEELKSLQQEQAQLQRRVEELTNCTIDIMSIL